MKVRRVVSITAVLVLLIAIIAVVFPCRYVVLSKLNVNLGENESAIGLRKVADIPLQGGATRFDYQSIDPHRRAHQPAYRPH